MSTLSAWHGVSNVSPFTPHTDCDLDLEHSGCGGVGVGKEYNGLFIKVL